VEAILPLTNCLYYLPPTNQCRFMQSHLQAYGENCRVAMMVIAGPFNHDNVAFQLTGEHAQVDCGECHVGARALR
jgi:hypothetical protein